MISQAVLYQENISKADQNYVSGFTYIPLESIQKEKEQPMGEKDITEKILEDYNDVFADIINGLVFKGEQRILPESLKNAQVHSQYKAEDGKVHELERDVIKYWKEKEVELAICGIENQSNVKKYMPFRIIGYDGAAYRSQLLDDRKEILYYNGRQAWKRGAENEHLRFFKYRTAGSGFSYRGTAFDFGWCRIWKDQSPDTQDGLFD